MQCEFDGARLTSLSLRGRFAPVAISQSQVESLENLRRKRKPFHRDSFCQNVFDISGKGGYNKDVETQTVATNITYLFPICEFRHSQISESSGCDRRLTFFLSEANRRSGRDARRSKEPRTGLEVLCISPPLGYFPQELYTCLHSAPAG